MKKQTKDTAETYGLFDRGQIVEGYKADFNLIDFEKLRVTKPEVVYLPAGGKRVQQKAVGYRHTFIGCRGDGRGTAHWQSAREINSWIDTFSELADGTVIANRFIQSGM